MDVTVRAASLLRGYWSSLWQRKHPKKCSPSTGGRYRSRTPRSCTSRRRSGCRSWTSSIITCRLADGALAGIQDRPIVLKRFVNGAEGEAFYQKRAPEQRPSWLRTVTLVVSVGPDGGGDRGRRRRRAGLDRQSGLHRVASTSGAVGQISIIRTNCESIWTRFRACLGRTCCRVALEVKDSAGRASACAVGLRPADHVACT